MNKILVSAVEPSANLHLKEILSYMSNYQLSGIFDEEFGTPLYNSKEFAVMGIIDALKKYFKAKEAIEEMAFLSKDIDIVLLIDAPSFNLPLAKKIKKQNPNIKIIYYILPKVWIWKKYRAKQIEQYADEIISIFPFEKEFYPTSKYFGNPLYNQIKEYKTTLTSNNSIAFLPGSRKSEIKSLMPIFRELKESFKNQKLLLAIAPSFSDDDIKELFGDISGFEIYRNTHKCITEASFAYVCSGTATLEVSMIGTPMVLVYKAKKVDYFLINLFANLKYIGLANIIFDYAKLSLLHEELIQENLTITNLLNAYHQIDKELFFKNSLKLRELLKGDASLNVAKICNNF